MEIDRLKSENQQLRLDNARLSQNSRGGQAAAAEDHRREVHIPLHRGGQALQAHADSEAANS